MDLLRESSLGQLIRFVTRNKRLLYPEEEPDYKVPSAFSGRRGSSDTIVDTKDSFVDWYGPDDPANPQNWSFGKKLFVAFQICLLTFTVYLSAAIITPGFTGIMAEFGVSEEVVNLVLAIYVLAYGLGPVIFSPLSEVAKYGRTLFYVAPMALYVPFQAGAATVHSFAGLVILRFITGFLGSAALATGGASLTDIFSPTKAPYAFAAWTYAAVVGPTLGPLISGFAVQRHDWRWAMQIQLWLTGFVVILLFVGLPETCGHTILYRRAARLRKMTGNKHIRTQIEIEEGKFSVRRLVTETIARPFAIAIKDPSVGFSHLYTAFMYTVYYLFFVSFPVLYTETYGFGLGVSQIPYLSIGIGIFCSMTMYLSLYRFVVEPKILKDGPGPAEGALLPALAFIWLLPIGLFMFAWTARASVPWIVPTIAVGIYSAGVFVTFQCIFAYIASSYPRYAASIFAGNDLLRSSVAAGILMAGLPFVRNLGIAHANTILGALAAAGIPCFFLIYLKGESLRARAGFAAPEAQDQAKSDQKEVSSA